MQLHLFHGSDGFSAVTSDPTGANLPDVHGPWNKAEGVDIDEVEQATRIGLDTEKVRNTVEKEGYYLARLLHDTEMNGPSR